MKKIIAALFLLTIASLSFAQKQSTENSLLWKITGKDLKDPSYLFGTIHMICQDQYLWTDVMKNAFNSTHQLYLELPMADEDFQMQMMKQIMLTDSTTLKDFFTSEQYRKLDQFFKDSMKTSLSVFSKMKPFGIMSFALLKLVDCQGKAAVAYENKLMGYAKEKNIPVKGLETIEQQMSIFDKMPKDTMAKMVMSTIEDLPKSKQQFQNMIKAYLAQNLESLLQETLKSPEYAAHLDALLYQRNARWIPQILSAAKQQSTFFAVGAGHLPGNKGVIKLLREQGYQVTPVK